MTVIELVTDVLRNLGVISEIATPSAEQGQDAVGKLNDLMGSLEEDGIYLGFNPKATAAETIALPDGDRITIKAMLGILLCDKYGLQPPPPVMSGLAKAGYDRLLRNATHAQMRELTPDAPRGQNNRFSWNIVTGQ